MGDAEKVKDASEINYRLLEQELRELGSLTASLKAAFPDHPLTVQVADKTADLVLQRVHFSSLSASPSVNPKP